MATKRKKKNRNKGKNKNKNKKPNKSIKKPKRPKKNPPRPKDKVKTTKTPKTYEPSIIGSDEVDQQGEILNAYLAMAAIELFQYTNETTIDGKINDVFIINTLSNRRGQYSANDQIDLSTVMISKIWVDGTTLNIDIDPQVVAAWEECDLTFDIIVSDYEIIETV